MLNKPFALLLVCCLVFGLPPPFFFMVERMLFLKYRQLNDDEQKEHFCRRLSYLRANMREYIKDKPVFNTASFARDVEAMRM